MVAGFYFTIVLAILSKTTLPKPLSTVSQAFCFAAAVACLVAGIMAIVKVLHHSKTPSLTTLHSWIAIICIGCFTGTLATKYVATPIVKLHTRDPEPDTEVQQASFCFRLRIRLPVVQLALELLTLGTLTLTILTGITMRVGQCTYVNLASYGSDPNPAQHYPHLPTACKIAFGIGICVIVTSLLVATVAIYRTQWSVSIPTRKREPSVTSSIPGSDLSRADPPPPVVRSLSDP
jgi:hypothetical protein